MDQATFVSELDDLLLQTEDTDVEDENESVVVDENISKKIKREPGLDMEEAIAGSSKASIPEMVFTSSTLKDDKSDRKWFRSTKETDPSIDQILDELESVYVEERGLVVRNDGLVSTPLHALKDIAGRYDEALHTEITYFPDSEGKRLARVELFAGAFRGIGEAYHRRHASQMAAIDLLRKMEGADSTLKSMNPLPYAIYPGWRIKPHVCTDLLEVCKANKLKYPRYVTKSNVDKPHKPLYSVQCFVGNQQVSVGLSDMAHVARKLAAYYAIQYLTGLQCPLEYVALGPFCTSYSDLLQIGYTPVMSETKKQWLLDETMSHLSPASRGIDLTELEALHSGKIKEEMDEIITNKSLNVTVNTDKGAKRRIAFSPSQ